MPTSYTFTVFETGPGAGNDFTNGEAVIASTVTVVDQNDDGQFSIAGGDTVDGEVPIFVDFGTTLSFQTLGSVTGVGIGTGSSSYLFPTDGTVPADDIFVEPPFVTVSGVDTGAVSTMCFSKGSLIATPGAERAVETLQTGDLVTTATGRTVPVKWIGRQTAHKLFAGDRMQPVRIRAGALGDGAPHTDLTVTADHGMIIDGLVINAGALVNGSSIDWVPLAELDDIVTYYHIETEAHDVILANGAAAETFIDYAGRQAFDNYAEYVELYGAERIIPEMAQPRISSARMLPETVARRLRRRAAQDDVWVRPIAV